MQNITGLYSAGQSGLCVRGYTILNQVMASSCCLPPSWEVTLISSRGVLVGNRHHLSNSCKMQVSQGYTFLSIIPLMSKDQSIPCTCAKWINVDPCPGSLRSNDDPPIRRSLFFAGIFEEIVSEVDGNIIIFQQLLPPWILWIENLAWVHIKIFF